MTRHLFDRITGARGLCVLFGVLSALSLATPAQGQPVDPWASDPPSERKAPGDVAPDERPDPGPDEAEEEEADPGDRATRAGDPEEEDTSDDPDVYDSDEAEDQPAESETASRPEPEEIPIILPNIFNAPTGRLLTAGLIFASATIDTGGGLSGEIRAGLGDVAEFGIETSDLIRARRTADDDAERIWPYVLATFKMGLAEDRLFDSQPALALGFRKSFSRETDAYTTRVAELYLVATKSLGKKSAIHVGGAFWDAELQPINEDPSYFHDRGWQKQLRPFGGIEIEPLPDAKILLETFWVPEFCYECAHQTKLIPNFAWGVRYEALDWVLIESGVRVPDIREVNLIDAQIFSQVSFVSRKLTRLMKKEKQEE